MAADYVGNHVRAFDARSFKKANITSPNVLALNFASTLTQSLLYLVLFIGITACLLFYFYRSTLHCDRYNRIEGLQHTETRGTRWGLVIVTFLLTVIYLPLSTMAVHVIVWSEELWPMDNPYKNATLPRTASGLPILDPLGPVEEYRDPLDFCWTTTMKRNEVNYAAVIVIVAVVTVFFVCGCPFRFRDDVDFGSRSRFGFPLR